jgi:hypothetical protein
MSLGDLITFLGPFSLASIILGSLAIISSLFLSAKKEERGFLALVFLVLLMLLFYIVSDSLLAFFGFNTGDQARIEENKHIIILFSRLEIFFLTLSIISFSGFVSYLVRSKVAIIKFLLTALVGLIIGILALFSQNFFYNDRLKLNINKYMGQEGDLFLIFIAFFAIVVVFELVFLLLSRKKIKKDASSNLERLKSVIVGFLVIILFGVLEALELFGLIHLYPYVPSLLGIGTIIFGLIMLRLALFDFQEKIKELRFLDSLLDRLGKEKKEIFDRLTLQYSEFNENLNSLKESFRDAFRVPSLSMQYINEIIGGIKRFSGYYSSKLDEFREIFEKFKSYKEVEKEVVEFDINEFLGEIGKKYREFENLKNRIKDVKSYETAILENFSAFSGNTDKFDSVFTQVFSLVEKLDELIERLRIVSINTEIVSYKKSIQESSFLESVSSEILDKVSESKVLLRLVLDDLEKLRGVEENLKNDVVNSVDIIMSAINDLDSYVLEFEPPEEYKLLLGNIYSGIVNMLKYTQVIVDFVNTLEHFVLVEMKEFNDNLKVGVALGSEVFSLQSHLSDTVKMLGENIYFTEEVLKNHDFLSLKNFELKF